VRHIAGQIPCRIEERAEKVRLSRSSRAAEIHLHG